MSAQLVQFEVRLLTTSKEVGLRRLRGFAASLGGTGEICYSFDELIRCLEVAKRQRLHNLVIHDQSLTLTAQQLSQVSQLARLFVINQPEPGQVSCLPPPASSPFWQAESYLQCSLATFLDSPIVRMSMTQLLDGSPSFPLAQLLRWGHTAETWQPGRASVTDAGQTFVRSLSLSGESRRLSETFCHFLEARLGVLKLRTQRVTFGADGLLTMVSASCTPLGGAPNLPQIAAELHAHQLPITIISARDGRDVELGGLYYPNHSSSLQYERVLLVVGEGPAAALTNRGDSAPDADDESPPADLDAAG